MDELVLRTKLFVPPVRPELVSRGRLIERLNAGLDRELTLISAPAGSGKTTLLSEWIALVTETGPSPPRVAWLSLDEEDDESIRFWTYVVAALQTTHPELGHAALQGLRSPQPPPIQTLLTSVLNEIAALSGKTILILDDFHCITDAGVHEDLSFLLTHTPRPLHVVVSTRVDPPLPIVRLRARGRLNELRSEDLRFNADEAASFLNEAMGLDLAPEDVRALELRTEGWVVGLQLAALALKSTVSAAPAASGQPDVRSFIEGFAGTHHYILEYLIEEVLSSQPEPWQRFLLQTSVLDRLCGPLCDAVLVGAAEDRGPAGDGETILKQLHRANLFITPLDDDHFWFRYHRLFVDLMRKVLHQRTSPGVIRELHSRAAAWYEENGFIHAAVKHALQAGDSEAVARLAERAARASLVDSRLTNLLGWLEDLPGEVLGTRLRLRIYRAWALFLNGHLTLSQQALQEVRQALQDLPATPANEALRQEATVLLDLIDRVAQGFLQSIGGQTEAAMQTCIEARNLALEHGHVFLAAQATEGLALAQYHRGQLRASAQSCREVIELAEQGAGQGVAQAPLAAAGYVELAGLHREWNDLGTAGELLDRAIALCEEVGQPQTLSEAYVAQSRLRQAMGDLEGAAEALAQAERVGRTQGAYSIVNFRMGAQQAVLNLVRGDLDAVVRWVEGVEAAFASGETGLAVSASFHETLQMLLARVHLARGEAGQALNLLNPLYGAAEAAGTFLRVVEVGVLRALAQQALGDTTAALASLEKALLLAEPEGSVRVFLNEGAPMAALLRLAVSQGIAPDYGGKLLAAFPAEGERSAEGLEQELPGLAERLTPRELQVLRLMGGGYSNQQIADELVIALNTVKRHVSHIFGKLNVRSRTQAVLRAREFGLL